VLLTTFKHINGYNRMGNSNSPLAVVKDANAAVITPPPITPPHHVLRIVSFAGWAKVPSSYLE
jgi:hypothetical protein